MANEDEAKQSTSAAENVGDENEAGRKTLSSDDLEDDLSSDYEDYVELSRFTKLIRYLVMASVAIAWICFIIACAILTYVGVIHKPALDPSRLFYYACFIGMTSCIVGFGGAQDIHKQTLWIYCALLFIAMSLTLVGVAATGGVIFRVPEKNDTSIWTSGQEYKGSRLSISSGRNGSYASGYHPSGRLRERVSLIAMLHHRKKAAMVDYDYRWVQFGDVKVLRQMTFTLLFFEFVAFLCGICLLKCSGDTWWKLWVIDMSEYHVFQPGFDYYFLIDD